MNDAPLPNGESLQQMSDLVRDIARALVDEPNSVRVEMVPTEAEVTFRLYVSESDQGKLIGKQGRTARSLRAIVGAVGSKLRIRCSVDIQPHA